MKSFHRFSVLLLLLLPTSLMGQSFDCRGSYTDAYSIWLAANSCRSILGKIPSGWNIGRSGPCAPNSLAYDGQGGAGGYLGYESPYWNSRETDRSCVNANVDPQTGKHLGLSNLVFRTVEVVPPPPPPPPPPPAACSYISGTNNQYTAGCVASANCLAQPDGTFSGNCSATGVINTCFPTATTLCLDDAPKDGRFNVTLQYQTSQGGGGFGPGQAIGLDNEGVTQGGLFWLFNSTNPEVLVKIVDGCTVNNHVWVFAAGTTNVGLSLTVLDNKTKFQQLYTTPDGKAMEPIQDTITFPCK